MNKSEQILSAFSQMFFYKDLVQENLYFTLKGDTERELADLLLNLGDLIIAIQLKARSESEQTTNQETELKWLEKKCKVAKKQIKDTICYISSEQLPEFQNVRGEKISINPDAHIIPLIIFVNYEINNYPHVLVKHSEKGIDVNCMSLPDFQEMCRILVAPIEIVSYLEYRQTFYERNPQINLLFYADENDDIILTHPMKEQALVYQFLAIEYNVQKASERTNYLHDFQTFLHLLPEHTVEKSEEAAPHSILLFMAHFNRLEIKAFNERLQLAKEKSKSCQYGIVGSLRREDVKYAIFFVASKPGCMLPIEYLLQLARQKADVNKLLQIVVYWENSEEFRIDYVFWYKT